MSINPSTSEIFNDISEIFKNTLNIKNLKLESEINDQLKLDSIQLLTLITEIENHYEVNLPLSLEESPKTIKDLVNIIHKEITNAKLK